MNLAALTLVAVGILLLGVAHAPRPDPAVSETGTVAGVPGGEVDSSFWAQATRGGESFWASDSNCDSPSSWNQQFTGTAGGGVPPYTYTWYFGSQT